MRAQPGGPPVPDRDPLAGSAWSRPGTVAGFVQSPPNERLLQLAAQARPSASARLLDIGCGAGRNAVPLAREGWHAVGTDLSRPMIEAASARASQQRLEHRLRLLLAPMDALPFASVSFDFVVAHGIWNLARSSSDMRRAMSEAGRVARRGATLFVFTFSRHTLPDDASPVPGESFVFTQFSGEPQCFLTASELVAELARAGFEPDPRLPLHELNRRPPGALQAAGAPVIYEGAFRRT